MSDLPAPQPSPAVEVIEPTTVLVPKRHKGGQPGNRNALKHGLYSRLLLPDEKKSLDRDSVGKLDDEITMMRALLYRTRNNGHAWLFSEEKTAPYVQELREYFAGLRRKFDFALDLHGTDFQKRCWKALTRIPYGKTKTYAQIAKDNNVEMICIGTELKTMTAEDVGVRVTVWTLLIVLTVVLTLLLGWVWRLIAG